MFFEDSSAGDLPLNWVKFPDVTQLNSDPNLTRATHAELQLRGVRHHAVPDGEDHFGFAF